MIYIPEFPEVVRSHLGGGGGLPEVFIRFLFGEEVETSRQAELIAAGVGTYQQAAILGYRLGRSGKDKKLPELFRRAMDRISLTSLEDSNLPQDTLALLGMALGLRALKDKKLTRWFREILLAELPLAEKQKGLDDFLRVIADPDFHAILSIRCDEYRLFLAAWPKQNEPEKYKEDLKAYFVTQRKVPFMSGNPGTDEEPHFFQSILGVYVMDRCLQQSIWEPEALEKMENAALQPVRDYVTQKIRRRALLISFVAVLAFIGGMVFLSWKFFQFCFHNPDAGRNWNMIEDSFYLFGGSVSTFLLLVRLVSAMLGRKAPSFEVDKLAARISEPRIARRLKAMGLATRRN